MGSSSANDFMDSVKNSAQDGMNKFEDVANNLGNKMVDVGKDVVKDILDATTTVTSENTASSMVPNSYEIDETNKWGWITLYVVTIVIAILGNLLFIVSCLCTKRTRTTGYYLLINLSIRDILVATLCVPFTLDTEVINMTWYYGDIYCICYRYFYYCFLFFLPLTLLFLAWHLFVENCKWNFAGEEGTVPRPWAHTIYIPLIWFFSAAFAVPTVFWSDVRPWTDDFYRNEKISWRQPDAKVCMHAGEEWLPGSDYFYIASNLVTFSLPVIMLFLPWWALLVQICACCTRKLRSSEFWLSLMVLFMILFYEASRAPFELFNYQYILSNWGITNLEKFLPQLDAESYRAVMKWAVYAPALLHPLLYFTFSPEARHGAYILFSRCCSCCCTKSTADVETASDDEKGQMLNEDQEVPLQSKQEEEM